MSFDFRESEVLITGGTSGIGLGLAERFLGAGARVVVTGRKHSRPGITSDRLTVVASDIGSEIDRIALAARVSELLPNLNVVINNAGIQRRVGLAADDAPWAERQTEIDILLAGPIHLNHLLIPRLLSHRMPSMIANVSSGGAFVPQVFAPTYSACKAAIHSYTMILREALAKTSCQVVEIIPPAVQTHLGGADPHGAPLDAFCDTVFSGLVAGRQRIGFGFTEAEAFVAAEKHYADLFRQSAERADVPRYR
ncbi:SDR family oxidoreductase [Rhizobium mesosinicum]|uniref:SDR family NAD(P)-dependent oxidoreductase n=1 Tax=Rhizobium mesosinicum TaxID=335017 RepID=A0ABS7GXD8_9HYPH|nr:SDR family NAD(P)-dependent oxidoreductase [Rhizobium mesosinicum]MBW9054638.1 SDR family NAD(P)-dependent oxidoreductase [Rhizobium mesosinicum]